MAAHQQPTSAALSISQQTKPTSSLAQLTSSRSFHAGEGAIVFVHPGKQLGGSSSATGRAKMLAAALWPL
jgi:hypothetical protein